MKETNPTTGIASGNSKKKTNGYKNNILHAKEKAKQTEADNRNSIYSALTTQQKIARVAARNKKIGGTSTKELLRLDKQLANEKPTDVAVAPAVKVKKSKAVKA